MKNFVNKIKNTILNWMQYVELELLVFISIFYIFFLVYLNIDSYQEDTIVKILITIYKSFILKNSLIEFFIFLYSSIIYLLAELVLITAYQINKKYFKKHLKFNMPKWYKILWAICITIASFFNLYVLGIWYDLIAHMIF